jgi:hypothetical protein
MDLGFIILLAIAIPIVVVWPLLIWAGAIRGIYMLVRGKVRGRAKVSQTEKVMAAQETAPHDTTQK